MQRSINLHFDHTNRSNESTNSIVVERISGSGVESRTVRFVHNTVIREPQTLDGYMFAFLLEAMQSGVNLVVNGPVSLYAMRNAFQLMEAWNHLVPEVYQKVDILAQSISYPKRFDFSSKREPKSILCYSGGLDANFSAIRHSLGLAGMGSFKVSDVCIVHGFDVKAGNFTDFQSLMKRIESSLSYLEVVPQVVWTDIRENERVNWEHSHGMKLASILHQFSHDFKFGLIGSSSPYSSPNIIWGSSPSLDHLLSGMSMEIIHDGAGFSRTDKALEIVKHPVLLENLKVCWEGSIQSENCGSCEKCIRTHLALFVAGAGKRIKCFPTELSVEAVGTIEIKNQVVLKRYKFILDELHKHPTDFHDYQKILQKKVDDYESMLKS